TPTGVRTLTSPRRRCRSADAGDTDEPGDHDLRVDEQRDERRGAPSVSHRSRPRTRPGAGLAHVGYGGRERMPQDVFGVVDEDEAQLSAEFLRHVLEVPLVPARQDHGPDTSSVSGQDLLLDPADGEDLAAERDLAR